MQKVEYRFENREAVIEQMDAEGKRRIEDILIDLDVYHIPQICYFIVEDAPPSDPDLLAAADERILVLEYENLILKAGMTIYDVLKRVIARGGYDAADLQGKMDVFLLYNRLTVEQYDELMASMAA